MSSLAEVHYRQARSFLAAGDAPRAIDLLEKARVLVRDDRDLAGRVYEELATAYDAAGQHDKGAYWRQQAAKVAEARGARRRAAPSAAGGSSVAGALSGAGARAGAAGGPPGYGHGFDPAAGPPRGPGLVAPPRRAFPLWAVIACSAAAALLVGAAGTYVTLRLTGKPAAPDQASNAPVPGAPAPGAPATRPQAPATVSLVAPATAPVGSDLSGVGPGGPTGGATAPARRPADPPGVVVKVEPNPSTAAIPGAPVPPAGRDRQQLLKDNVGLVIVMLRYEGNVRGRHGRIDVPLGMGTAFAVNPTGVMLTNRHVIEAGKPGDIPVTLEDSGLPTMTLRETTYLVCFGANPGDHFPAKLLHKSDTYDLAVLKVERAFPTPLAMATRPLRQGDDILCCGYPGAVTQALNQSANTPDRVRGQGQKWRATGQVNPLDNFSPDSFNSTLTRGIVSAPERNVNNVSYLQMDAAISPGNSGGPVLNLNNEVVGIATFGLKQKNGPATNYNFALLAGQFQAEVEAVIKQNGG